MSVEKHDPEDIKFALGFALRLIIEGKVEPHHKEWAKAMKAKFGV